MTLSLYSTACDAAWTIMRLDATQQSVSQIKLSVGQTCVLPVGATVAK